MRAVFGAVLLVGVALAAYAVHLVRGHYGAQQAQMAMLAQRAAQVVETAEVVTLKKPVDYGAAITADHLTTIRWPIRGLPPGVFTDLEAMLAEDAPRLALRRMEIGEPLMEVKITAPGEDAGLGSRLGSGMRAFAISTDATSGVSGFLRPDDRVDVYWTGSARDSEEFDETFTKLIEAGMRILATDQTDDTGRRGARVARTITVEATPRQVAALTHAQATGRLTLSLVGHGDDYVAAAVELDQNDVLGIEEREPEPVVAEAAPQRCTIRTRRGAEVVEIPIPCSN